MPHGAICEVRFICSGHTCLSLSPHISWLSLGVLGLVAVLKQSHTLVYPPPIEGWVSVPHLSLNLDEFVTAETTQVSSSDTMRLSRLGDESRYHTCLVCGHSHSQHCERLQRKVQVLKLPHAGTWSAMPEKQCQPSWPRHQ